MDKRLIHQFVSHPYRNWFVAGASLALAIAGGLPFWEERSLASKAKRDIQEEIRAISLQSELLPKLRSDVEKKNQEVTGHLGIEVRRLPEHREQIQQLIRSSQCRLISSSEGKTLKQPWSPDIDPLELSSSIRKDKPKFEIAATSITFTVEGKLQNLDRLMAELRQIHKFAVISKLNIQQPQATDDLRMDFEMTMFQIIKTGS